MKLWFGISLKCKTSFEMIQVLKPSRIVINVGEAYKKRSLLKRFFHMRIREALGFGGELMIDSGGFARVCGDGGFSAQELADIYKMTDADAVVSLDAPVGPSESVDRARATLARNVEDFRFLTEALAGRVVVPVVHGRCHEEITEWCEGIMSVDRSPVVVGAGGLVPVLRRGSKKVSYTGGDGQKVEGVGHIRQVVSTIRSAFESSSIHLFGAGTPSNIFGVFHLGANSTDSIAWRRVAAFGAILLPGFGERIVSDKVASRKSRRRLGNEELEVLGCCGCPVCSNCNGVDGRKRQLAQGFRARAIHNAWVIAEEVKAFSGAILEGQEERFLMSRIGARNRIATLIGIDRRSRREFEANGASVGRREVSGPSPAGHHKRISR